MATFSIKQNFKHVPVQEETQYKAFSTAILNDLAATKAAIAGINAQLDADAGVTDTDYAANWNTAALELTA